MVLPLFAVSFECDGIYLLFPHERDPIPVNGTRWVRSTIVETE